MRSIFVAQALFATFALSVVSFAAFATEERSLTTAAQNFIVKGAEPTLRKCALPKPRCGDAKLLGNENLPGESNDEKRLTRTITFDGLEIALTIPVMNRRRYLVGKVEISSSKWPVDHGLQVGQLQNRVVDVLGLPTTEAGNCIQYFNEISQSSVGFCFSSGRIAKILWERWVD